MSESDELDRRSVLRTVGAVGAAAVGASGVGTARDTAERPGVTPAEAAVRLDRATADLTEELTAAGVSASALDVTSLPTREFGEVAAGETGVATFRYDGTTYTLAKRKTAAGELRVFHNVTRDTAYAVVDGETREAFVAGDGETRLTGSCDDSCSSLTCESGFRVFLDYEYVDGSCEVVDTQCPC